MICVKRNPVVIQLNETMCTDIIFIYLPFVSSAIKSLELNTFDLIVFWENYADDYNDMNEVAILQIHRYPIYLIKS